MKSDLLVSFVTSVIVMTLGLYLLKILTLMNFITGALMSLAILMAYENYNLRKNMARTAS